MPGPLLRLLAELQRGRQPPKQAERVSLEPELHRVLTLHRRDRPRPRKLDLTQSDRGDLADAA